MYPLEYRKFKVEHILVFIFIFKEILLLQNALNILNFKQSKKAVFDRINTLKQFHIICKSEKVITDKIRHTHVHY